MDGSKGEWRFISRFKPQLPSMSWTANMSNLIKKTPNFNSPSMRVTLTC